MFLLFLTIISYFLFGGLRGRGDLGAWGAVVMGKMGKWMLGGWGAGGLSGAGGVGGARGWGAGMLDFLGHDGRHGSPKLQHWNQSYNVKVNGPWEGNSGHAQQNPTS